jgi:hypothetical protein
MRLDPIVVEASDAIPGEVLTLEYRSSVGLIVKSWPSVIVFTPGNSPEAVPLALGKGTSVK